MNRELIDEEREERDLVKMYMELMGTNESGARSVFMHVCREEESKSAEPGTQGPSPGAAERPESREASGAPGGATALLLLLLWLAGSAGAARGALPSPSHQFITQPLSLADALDLALQQNPNILRAKKDLEAAQGVVIETRAVALPRVGITGSFNALQRTDVDRFSVPTNFPGNPGGLSFGVDQNWASQIRLVQSLYQGGRMLSALRAARLTKEQSLLNYQTAVADTVLDVEIAYDDTLLAEQQITVQEASVDLLTQQLSDTRRRFDAGTVPRFNVLRAEVELANARPRLIRARNSFRIAKNNLANLLGFNVPKETFEDIPLNLSGKLHAEPYQIDLGRAIETALDRRSELGSLRKARALRAEDILNAKAGYKPAVEAFGGYDVHNSMLHSDISYEINGWITGVQVSWNLFDGFLTRGRVKEATARYERAGIELDDTGRRIELEVRTARSNFIEAQDVLESQKKVVEEAEEALRLARSRYEAGTGTQLDVLSAQTALTDARTTEIQALHDYSVARSRLERAIGMNVPTPLGSAETNRH
ncbi:MAG TPA: TolC family protein [Dongiaceae bacterium]|nr:TolC family protein [Dongiaceae bacterium]